MEFDKAFELVIGHEGGYVNDPTDRGGETKYGVSKKAYPDLDIKNLTLEDAKDIYYKDYWLKANCDKLNKDLRYIHFDTAVNMGISRAVKILQQSACVAVDGVFGSQTQRASQTVNKLLYAINKLAYYCDIVAGNNSQVKYIRGWKNRVIDNIKY